MLITMLRRRAAAVPVLVGAMLAATLAGALPASGVGNGVTQATPVSALPSTATPNITNGTVYSITQVGSQIIVGGSFTTVQNYNSTTTLTRTDVLAFDANSGTVSTSFAPTLDGTVEAVAPGPVANTVYVGGFFNNVNGAKNKGIVLLNTQTGAIASGWRTPSLDGAVYSVGLVGSRLLLAGTFATVAGVAHAGVASLNATSGALDPYMSVQLSGHHNYNGVSGANGAVGPRAMAINPSGTRMTVIGNFNTADGATHDQIAQIILGSTSASVDPNWNTNEFTAACFSNAFDTYVTDVQWSPDGTYFIVTATGGSGTNVDGSKSLCDSASRWEASSSGTNVQPTWVDYTGQDSLWSTAITGSAVYVGGHQRWLNNYNGYDYPGEGAVPRPGLAALDPVSGTPLSWNPGRNPRGAGAYALFVNSAGLYVGSDTDYIGNNQYKRQKIAYFPLAGGVATASTATAQLPSNLYEAGQLPNSSNTNILYRVDAGGPTIAATDNGPDWMADGSNSDPGAQYRNADSNAAGWACCATRGANLPASAPTDLFNSERWDPGSKNDGDEMHWSFPVAAGTHVTVRLYFANRYSGTSGVGQRVFDVAVDGTTVLPNYDIVADVGDQTGTMKSFDVTSPGAITIDLTHEVENPLINGIEIINDDVPASGSGGASVDDLAYRSINGNSIGNLTTVPNTGISWSTTRGAFMVGSTIFYGTSSSTFYKASFDGTTVGTPVVVDPYNDPYWSNIQTGSGQTYRGTVSDYYGELPNVTGAFYSNGRLFYSLLGQSALYSRWFNPDSGVVGAQEFTTTGFDFSAVAGMVLSGTTLYYANRNDGTLHTISFVNGVPDGSTDTTVSGPNLDGRDWRSRGMFLYGTPAVASHVTFVAQAGYNGKTASASVTVPSAVSAGDTMLMFVSTGGTGVSPTAPTGWAQVTTKANDPLNTWVYARTAASGDAGSTVTLPLSTTSQVDVRLVDYSGVAGGSPAAATASDSNTMNHVTPSLAISAPGSWVVSYWTDRNSSASTWALPSTVTPRSAATSTAAGHVDAAVADSGQAVTSTSYGGLTASTGVVSGKGNMITIQLSTS